jgi:protein-tyrosine phosphatase
MSEFQVPADVMGDGRIWIGSAGDALNIQWLLDQNITHVVNCGPALSSYARRIARTNVREVLVLEAEDDEDYPIFKHFDVVSQFCSSVLNDQTSRVLFHCIAGINRSAALALAYATTLSTEGSRLETLAQLLVNVRSQRPVILTNEGFYNQLIELFM